MEREREREQVVVVVKPYMSLWSTIGSRAVIIEATWLVLEIFIEGNAL